MALLGRFCTTITLLVLLAAPTARADSRSFNVDHLQLSVTSDEFLATEGQGLGPRWRWRTALQFGYANQLLLADTPQGRQQIVASRSLLEASAAVSFGLGISVGLTVPVLLDQGGQAGSGAALGDLGLMGRFDFFSRSYLTVGLILGLRLPTATSQIFFGEGTVIFEPRIILAGRYRLLHAGINIGARVREGRIYQDLKVQHELTASAAVALVPREWFEIFGEIHADTALSSRFFAESSTPVEVLAGLGSGAKGVRVRVAGGAGIVDGFGASRFRVLASISYVPPLPPPPRVTPPKATPPRPRPVPPPPPPPRPAPLPPPPPLPTIEQPEIDEAEPNVAVSQDFIELTKPIFFDMNSAHIHQAYHQELIELVRAIDKRPWIKNLWIEGHTDDTGPANWNMKLSQMRAQRVVDFLVAHGAQSERFHVLAFGSRKPWLSNAQEQGRSKNRRVMFLIERAESTPSQPESNEGGAP